MPRLCNPLIFYYSTGSVEGYRILYCLWDFLLCFSLSGALCGGNPLFFPVTSGCQGFPGGHGPAQRPASFLLLRGAYPFRAVTAPYSVQQASCYFGVRPPSGWSRPRTASSKPPVTSGPHGLPGRPGPVQRPASFLLLRGASPSREVLTPHSVQQALAFVDRQTLSLCCFSGCSVSMTAIAVSADTETSLFPSPIRVRESVCLIS